MVHTDYLVVRGRYQAASLTVHGTQWAAVAAHAAHAAGVGDAAGALPAAITLSSASTATTNHSQQQQQQPGGAGAAAASLTLSSPSPLPAPPLRYDASGSPTALPFASLPPQLTALLAGTVLYWRAVRMRLKSIQAHPPGQRLRGLMTAADAVLSALRGDGAPLARILAMPAAQLLPGRGAPLAPPPWPAGFGSGGGAAAAAAAAAVGGLQWDAATEADCFEMAAAWSELLLSPGTQPPLALEVAVAGLTAGVLLAASPVTGARLLAPAGPNGVWLVRAVRGALVDAASVLLVGWFVGSFWIKELHGVVVF